MIVNKEAEVVWIINQFAGHSKSGWGERHFFFAKHWKARGYRPVIISGSYNHMFNTFPVTTGTYTTQEYDGIEFCWVKTPHYHAQSVMRFWSFLVFAWRVLFISTRKYGTPEVILVSSMPIFPILSGYLLKKWHRARRLLFEIRDIWPLSLQLLGKKSRWHPAVLFIGWFERFGYRRADTVVSLLPNAEPHMTEVAGRPIHFVYIPNGIDEGAVGQDPLPEELAAAIPQDKMIIAYAGTIGLANAMEHLIEAAVLLKEKKDILFVLIGDGYLKEELIKTCRSLENILFLPKIPKNRVQSFLKHIDVCYVGWRKNKLYEHGVSANKYFDYMLAGKPILDSNQYIKDPVELSGCGIIVHPDSAEAIIQGILEFKNMSPQARVAMGEKGHQYVLQEHAIETLAAKYVALF